MQSTILNCAEQKDQVVHIWCKCSSASCCSSSDEILPSLWRQGSFIILTVDLSTSDDHNVHNGSYICYIFAFIGTTTVATTQMPTTTEETTTPSGKHLIISVRNVICHFTNICLHCVWIEGV